MRALKALRRCRAGALRASGAVILAGLGAGCVHVSYPVGPAASASAAAASAPGAAERAAQPPAAARWPHLLQAGDSFELKFFYSPELNESVVIRPDGRISLQLVGEVQAAGLEPAELEVELRRRYAKELRDPSVTVIVKQVAPQRVFVAGEVRTPGDVALQPDMTALQAIARAGFFTHDAETRNVAVLRYKGAQGPEFILLDMKALIDGAGGASGDIALQPMDIVFVPQTRIAGLADFFNRYLNNIVPLWRNVGFSMMYYTNSARVVQP